MTAPLPSVSLSPMNSTVPPTGAFRYTSPPPIFIEPPTGASMRMVPPPIATSPPMPLPRPVSGLRPRAGRRRLCLDENIAACYADIIRDIRKDGDGTSRRREVCTDSTAHEHIAATRDHIARHIARARDRAARDVEVVFYTLGRR